MHAAKKLAMVLLAATIACAGFANAQALKEIKVALSFPNGATWPYIAVAEEMGYFRQEGLKVDVVSLNGSAAAYKVIVTGQVDYGFCQPAQVLNGLAIDEQTKSFYTSYQGHVYQFATLAEGPYKRIADLKGQKIGISTLAGGQYPYLLATLKNAGLTVGPGNVRTRMPRKSRYPDPSPASMIKRKPAPSHARRAAGLSTPKSATLGSSGAIRICSLKRRSTSATS